MEEKGKVERNQPKTKMNNQDFGDDLNIKSMRRKMKMNKNKGFCNGFNVKCKKTGDGLTKQKTR